MTNSLQTFTYSPLITPERITNDPEEAFRITPKWAVHWTFAEGQPTEGIPAFEQGIVVAIGKKHRGGHGLGPLEFAMLSEITRFGHTIVTNTDGRAPFAYARVFFKDAPEDLMTVKRLILGLGRNEAVKTIGPASDMRAENLYPFGAGSPKHDSRKIALGHAERSAREYDGEEPLPFTVEEYLANTERLYDLIDQHRTETTEDEDEDQARSRRILSADFTQITAEDLENLHTAWTCRSFVPWSLTGYFAIRENHHGTQTYRGIPT